MSRPRFELECNMFYRIKSHLFAAHCEVPAIHPNRLVLANWHPEWVWTRRQHCIVCGEKAPVEGPQSQHANPEIFASSISVFLAKRAVWADGIVVPFAALHTCIVHLLCIVDRRKHRKRSSELVPSSPLLPGERTGKTADLHQFFFVAVALCLSQHCLPLLGPCTPSAPSDHYRPAQNGFAEPVGGHVVTPD